MAVQREVLVELVHIEGLHVADDVGAELGDVHVTEVDVLPVAVDQTTAFVFRILLRSVMKVGFRGRGRCGGAVGLPCNKNTADDQHAPTLRCKTSKTNYTQWPKPFTHVIHGAFIYIDLY